MFSELGDLLEPRRRCISPQLLAAIQCVRRWRRAGLGDNNFTKCSISDTEIEAVYGISGWS